MFLVLSVKFRGDGAEEHSYFLGVFVLFPYSSSRIVAFK